MYPLTTNQLIACMPGLTAVRAGSMAPHLVRAMEEGDITTMLRCAAFLAQLGHESCSLRYMEELASGSAYEGRKDLGNTQPGDGVRFKGRGPIQLTGRNNYRLAGKALGLDLEGHPEQAALPSVGFRTTCWFWKTHKLNELADLAKFDEITHVINGGQNGADDRRKRYELARKVLLQTHNQTT